MENARTAEATAENKKRSLWRCEKLTKNSGTRKLKDQGDYKRTQMQKDLIIQKLKEQGLRITKQRLILLDIILEEDCSCCKEIYYNASQKDDKIGSATVYRIINTLEEIGAISRKNMYRVDCSPECRKENACTIELEDNTVIELNEEKWNQIIRTGLAACGYAADGQKVRSITARSRTRECVEA